MADFDNLIEYLRLGRRAEEANDHQLAQDNVVLNYLEGGEACTATREDLMSDVVMYRRLYFAIIENNAQDIYLWHTDTSHKYYIKTVAGTYLNLYNNAIETPPEENLQEFHLEFGPEDYFYYAQEGRVVIATQELSETVIFNDVIDFDPEAGYLEDIQNDKYEYKFKTHTMRFAGDGTTERPGFVVNEVKVFKNTRKADINLIPVMEFEFNCTYKLSYLYYEPGYRPSFGIRERDCALVLDFGSVGGLLSFLNATLFSQGFDISYCSGDMARDNFRDSFESDILDDLRYKLGNGSELYFMDAMEMLYFLPPSVADDIPLETWWKLAKAVIKKEALATSRMLKEELFFIKLLTLLMNGDDPKENERWQKEFIAILCETTDKKQLALEYLCGALNGEDYTGFLKIVNRAWRSSRMYIDLGNTLYESSDGPFILPYESEKMIGFFLTNTKAYFDTRNQKERMIHVEFETGKYVIDTENYSRDGGEKTKEVIDHYWYHPFHPVYLANIGVQDTAIKLDALVPAFMLKANHDAQFWHNVMTGAEYAFDVATTISGVGNIAKLRYLSRLAKLAEGVDALSKARRAVNILRYVKGASGVMSITFGTTSTLMKLTGVRDTELGNAIWETLFYLELLTLGAEATASLLVNLRRSAGKILKYEEALRKTATTTGETADIERIIREMRKVAETDFMAKPPGTGKWGGTILKEAGIRKFRGELSRVKVLLILEEDVMAVEGVIKKNPYAKQFKKITIGGIEFENARDLFIYMDAEGGLGCFNAETRQMFLRKDATDLMAFHEKTHVMHWAELKEEYYTLAPWEKETHVWNEIWKQKNRWSVEELKKSLKYVNGYREKAGIELIKVKL
ncbi:zincin-like metallopeptidase toxin domain-containing protein [Flavobacterium sp. DGU11]|uniref:Zincin-like metallopeptidase toxin domain-containing protein n=1 Tax=Flavobacterium arundinis TaxID=3139143 RepID=A0ABU9HY77_9FLAO